MFTSRRRCFYTWLVIAFSTFISSPCLAQRGQLFQYSTKFVCGAGDGVGAVKGNYLTVINIHNPSDDAVQFHWKVALASPLPNNQLVSPFAALDLKPDGAGDLLCEQIVKQSRVHAAFMTGFLVIESKTQLDVVPVYTATDPTGRSISIDVLATVMRVIPAHKFPDLIVGGNCQSARIKGLVATAIIQNVGAAAAGPSLTRFIFSPSNGDPSTSTDIATPPLAVGASVTLTAPVPTTCLQPDCKVDVLADATNQVVESNESNNFDTATCIGALWPDRQAWRNRTQRRSPMLRDQRGLVG